MSGGSYDYLCYKEGDDFLSSSVRSSLESMRDRLRGLSYGTIPALVTEDLIRKIDTFQKEMDEAAKTLHDVWHAVEWWDSCDSSEAEVKAAVAEFRNIKLPKCKDCGGTGYKNKEKYLGCRNPNCSWGKDVSRIR